MKYTILAAAPLVLSACFFEKIETQDPNSIEVLSYEVELEESPADLIEEPSANLGVAAKKVETDDEFAYLGRVDAPEVAGKTVQANIVEFKGDYAIVGYNTAGDDFAGAMQVFKFKASDLEDEIDKTLTEVLLNNLDIQALHLKGNDLYFGGHTFVDDGRPGTSFIGKIPYKNFNANDIRDQLEFFDLGNGVTSIVEAKGVLYVAIGGETGGLLTLNSSLDSLSYTPNADIRQLLEHSDDIISVSGDVNGTSRLDNMSEDETIYEFTNTTSDEHRNDLIEHSKLYYVARADAGLDIVSEDGDLEYHLDNPAALDADLSKTHANGVSRDGHRIFLAQGEYGFRYIEYDEKDQEHELLGYFPYHELTNDHQENYSANALRYSKNHLFVASGVGGVMIFTMDD